MAKLKKRKDGRYQMQRIIDDKLKTFYGRTQAEVQEKYEDYIAALAVQKQQEQIEKTLGPLFEDFADRWYAEHERNVEPSTSKASYRRVETAKQRFESLRIGEITPQMVDQYIDAVSKMNRHGNKLSRKTVGEYLSILRQIFRAAIIAGYITSDPSALISPRGEASKRRELPSDEDFATVQTFRDDPFWLFAYLVMHTGLRRGEALALTYQDIDRAANIIYVDKAVKFDKLGMPSLGKPKTEAGIRTVPLLPPLADALPKQDIGLLFPGGTGNLMTEHEYKYRWKLYRKSSGVKCGAHQLRHSMATLCFEAELSDKDAQDILGHADIVTTKKIYTHIRDTRRKQNYDKLSALFSQSETSQTSN